MACYITEKTRPGEGRWAFFLEEWAGLELPKKNHLVVYFHWGPHVAERGLHRKHSAPQMCPQSATSWGLLVLFSLFLWKPGSRVSHINSLHKGVNLLATLPLPKFLVKIDIRCPRWGSGKGRNPKENRMRVANGLMAIDPRLAL